MYVYIYIFNVMKNENEKIINVTTILLYIS